MDEYHELVETVLSDGVYKPNRTGVDTVATFGYNYRVDLQAGYPLLTTKAMDGFRWNSMIYEFLWYLSGEEHIRTLREQTSIWDAWADEDGRLDTAYGRFWRRYPIPDDADQLPGETWADPAESWVNDDGTFDQLRYAIDQLQDNPHSRRIVVNAWHPANAAVSTLPPCHFAFVFNVQGGRLNVHLTQRSGDVALGVPFNLAAYALLANVVAQRVGLPVGTFAHTVTDAHIYCGRGDRGAWYAENLDRLQDRIDAVDSRTEFLDVKSWLEDVTPPEPGEEDGHDHVPGLLEQLAREPRDRPRIEVADVPLEELSADDIQLQGYEPADGLRFAVAE